MNNKTKWIMAGTLAVTLVVGLTLGAMAVAFVQRAIWGYSPAYAANSVSGPGQNWQDYSMPGPMMQGGSRWGGGPMMSPPNFGGRGPQGNFGPGMMGAGLGWGSANSLVAIAAEKLDMTTAELITELKSGKTIADLAKEKDVSLDSLVEAALAPRLERMTVMVSNGVVTQEQADAMTELMKTNLTARLNGEVTPGTCPGLGDTDGDGVCDYTGRGPRGGGRGMMWR